MFIGTPSLEFSTLKADGLINPKSLFKADGLINPKSLFKADGLINPKNLFKANEFKIAQSKRRMD